MGSLKSRANQYRGDAGGGNCSLLSLSEKTGTSNHLRIPQQRWNIPFSYPSIYSRVLLVNFSVSHTFKQLSSSEVRVSTFCIFRCLEHRQSQSKPQKTDKFFQTNSQRLERRQHLASLWKRQVFLSSHSTLISAVVKSSFTAHTRSNLT